MNFSIITTKSILPDEVRTTFNEFLQKEVAAMGPDQQLEALFNREPEQLSFQFDILKK
jgi:hypothetical protein